MSQVNLSLQGSPPVPSSAKELRIETLRKSFGAYKAIDGVDLQVPAGQFLTLLGPSGSGKTSLLMAIAGFLRADSGVIRLGETELTSRPPEKRNFGMVFQGYALFQHMTVEANVAFPLRVRKVDAATAAREVTKALELVDLLPLRKRLPRELSGGQQQRVALARALVFKPDILLLDEPLSALDKSLRTQLQWELKEVHRRTGMTFIYVTHDQEEALSMSDSITVLRRGKVEQSGAPDELYNSPNSKFIASFLGGASFLTGTVVGRQEKGLVYEINGHRFVHSRQAEAGIGDTVHLAIRPEKMKILQEGETSENVAAASVVDVKFLGSHFRIRAESRVIGSIDLDVPGFLRLLPGSQVVLAWEPDASVIVAPD